MKARYLSFNENSVISVIISVDGSCSCLHVTKGNNSAYTLRSLYKGNNSVITLCLQEMPIIFFKYCILIIMVESKYIRTICYCLHVLKQNLAYCYNGTK